MSSKEDKQMIIAKYIESIEVLKSKDKLYLGKINFRDSFMEEYDELVNQKIMDRTCLLQVDNQLGWYPAQEDKLLVTREYVKKLKQDYDSNYYEQFNLTEDEQPINKFTTKNKNERVIKHHYLQDDDKFIKDKYVGIGVLTTDIS